MHCCNSTVVLFFIYLFYFFCIVSHSQVCHALSVAVSHSPCPHFSCTYIRLTSRQTVKMLRCDTLSNCHAATHCPNATLPLWYTLSNCHTAALPQAAQADAADAGQSRGPAHCRADRRRAQAAWDVCAFFFVCLFTMHLQSFVFLFASTSLFFFFFFFYAN
jgi:hypothetical protein